MEHPQDEGDMETDRGTEESTVVEMTEVLGRIQKVADGTAIIKDHKQRNLIQDHERYGTDVPKNTFLLKEHAFSRPTMDRRVIEQAYCHVEPRPKEIPDFVCHANVDAWLCIAMRDYNQARTLIQEAKAVDPNNIHTYINLGQYLLDQLETDELDDEQKLTVKSDIVEAADTLSKLKSNPHALATAKMEYAFWLAETCRTDEDRTSGCQLMEECLQKDIPCLKDSKNLEATCRILYMKVIIRWLKNIKIIQHQPTKTKDWVEEKMKAAVDQLIYLSPKGAVQETTPSSVEVLHHQELLIWLMELQKSRIQKYWNGLLQVELERFREQTKQPTNISDCMDLALKLANINSIDHRYKARLGFIHLELAYQEERNIEVRKEHLSDALRYCEEGNQRDCWTLMSASTSAAAYLHLWALGFYERNTDFVNKMVKKRYNIRGKVFPSSGWRYLTTEFYSANKEKHSGGEACLEKIGRYYKEIITRHEKHGYQMFGLKLARVLCLQGKPFLEVLQVFSKHMSTCEENSSELATALQHRGHYKKVMGKLEEAKIDLEEAIRLKELNELGVSVALAEHDLEHIEYQQGIRNHACPREGSSRGRGRGRSGRGNSNNVHRHSNRTSYGSATGRHDNRRFTSSPATGQWGQPSGEGW